MEPAPVRTRPAHRGMRALADLWLRLRGPGLAAGALGGWRRWWRSDRRPQHLGLAAAPNTGVQARRDGELLRSAHPQVRAVLDAPAQMQRETEALRAAAGKAGDADLESDAAGRRRAWPQRPPVQTLRFEPGRLSLRDARLDRAADRAVPRGRGARRLARRGQPKAD